MEEKLNEALKGIYESLNDEQKEKAKACKTMSELTSLAAKEGLELPDDMLDAISGGGDFFTWLTCDNYDCTANDPGECL